MEKAIFGILFLVLFPVFSFAEGDPALIANGRELFNNKEGLSVKYACITCHKQNQAVKLAKVKNLGEKFPSVINKYLTSKSKGKALGPASEEMKALQAYILHEHAR